MEEIQFLVSERVLIMLMSVTVGEGLLQVPRESKKTTSTVLYGQGYDQRWGTTSFFLCLGHFLCC